MLKGGRADIRVVEDGHPIIRTTLGLRVALFQKGVIHY